MDKDNKHLIGEIKEDRIHNILEGYSINGIFVHKSCEEYAKENVGKIVEYELNYDGYRRFGAFNKKFYETAMIVKIMKCC